MAGRDMRPVLDELKRFADVSVELGAQVVAEGLERTEEVVRRSLAQIAELEDAGLAEVLAARPDPELRARLERVRDYFVRIQDRRKTGSSQVK